MEKYNLILGFLDKVVHDSRLMPTHVSLYTTLLFQWKESRFSVPFRVTRRELMQLSKIASTSTYHKCLKELIACGYIRYEPSYHPQQASQVLLLTDE
ncbi:hypothetical protein [Hufsiella ginkgonis]|uniref:MarR family transcriptional regulator n=1 Tax=Hufsiella ginkgonis TaxID=2695274 RepID=A0A7K1XST8_9SPHI|nr:hypothetical protein [Hufsiella ginkgonis]MXV14012.1 hypothetical protein [Hufsiella ginkgonis]